MPFAKRVPEGEEELQKALVQRLADSKPRSGADWRAKASISRPVQKREAQVLTTTCRRGRRTS